MPQLPTIFDLCNPRDDVLAGGLAESDFAADLSQVLRGDAPAIYADAAEFFRNTYPTRGLQNLMSNVCRRLSGVGGEAASIFRLDTQYGGGKTHGLIALAHAAAGMRGVQNAPEFIETGLLPKRHVRIGAFDGENADPANGRSMGDGIRALTPWGELAYALAGAEGYERVRRSDESRTSPGADTLRELFGGEPALILLDELPVYLRKVRQIPGAADQLTAFLTSLFKAIESSPGAALVYTLALGAEGRAADAYANEHQFIAERVAEVESVSARKATLLNPTEDDEAIHVLRRRLFRRIDEAGAKPVIDAYRDVWRHNGDALASQAARPSTVDELRDGYPFHPEVLETLTSKTATLGNFQRVRGMLRLLARTVARVWEQRPPDAHAIHVHHIDPGYEPIRQELVTRIGQSAFDPAIHADIVSSGQRRALAQQIDAEHYRGMPPYTRYAANTIFVHTLAFNEQLKGISPERLRFSMIGPALDISFIEDGRKRFVADSAYLDDRPHVPMRFLAEANLTQILRRQEQEIDASEIRAQLNDRISAIFKGNVFELAPFPGGAYEVPDESGAPSLAVMGYDAVAVGGVVERAPELVKRIYTRKGSEQTALRGNRNNVVFVLADENRRDEMKRKMARRLALREMRRPERLQELAEHQREKVRELESRAEQGLALAIQQCYRHVFYPSRIRLEGEDVDLAHTTVEIPSASAEPGSGQRQVVRALRENQKVRLSEDEPDSPAYIRDRTPLRNGEMSTRALREEFRRDPALPILIGDDVFIRAVRRGVDQGEYVYRRGDLLYGQHDPPATIVIDEQSFIFTMAYARAKGIWPRPEVAPGPVPPPDTEDQGSERPPDTVPPPTPSDLSAEGPLREALASLWEKARGRRIAAIHTLTIRMFDAGDALRLLAISATVPAAGRRVAFDGGYETRDGATLELSYEGPVTDALPVKDFLESQVRAARHSTLNASLDLTFPDGGLALSGDEPEKTAERLTRIVTGPAWVEAGAEQQDG